jgi:hypothetical protein
MSSVQSTKKSGKANKVATTVATVTVQPTVQTTTTTEATTVAQDVSSSTVDVKVTSSKKRSTPVVGVTVSKDSTPTTVPTVVQVAATSAPVPEQVAVSEPTVDVATSSPTVEVEEQSDDSFDSFDDVQKAIADVDRELLSLNRRRVQLNKIAQKKYVQLSKQNKKRNRGDKSVKRTSSGFNKPAHVPQAFCDYLKLDPSVQLPRTNITALLYKSIKDNNLLNSADKREVLATPELRSLLRMNDGENLRFENFQHYVSRVYKADVAATSASEGSASATD